jgi:hypothetical protein
MVKIIKNLTDLKNLIPSELMSIYQIDITDITWTELEAAE